MDNLNETKNIEKSLIQSFSELNENFLENCNGGGIIYDFFRGVGAIYSPHNPMNKILVGII